MEQVRQKIGAEGRDRGWGGERRGEAGSFQISDGGFVKLNQSFAQDFAFT